MKKWFRKGMALLMSAVMLTSLCVSALATDGAITDVPESSVFFPYVRKVVDAGLMQGYGNGKFGPNDSLTRGMFITVLYRAAGEPAAAGKAAFTDVAEGKYYSAAVKWAEEQGITKGYADSSFGVSVPVTRQHMATFLYRYASLNGLGMIPPSGVLDAFADAERVDEYARAAMAWAVSTGILQGSNGFLNPQAIAVRAHAAAVICRYMENDAVQNESGESAPDVPDTPDVPGNTGTEVTAYTREELEAALVETAWGYFLKGSKAQYDGGNLTGVSAMNGGVRRPPLVSVLEDATGDNTIYTVCSDYCWSVYQQTLGLPLFGDRRNASTSAMWWLSDAYGMTVARWVGDDYNKDNTDTEGDKATAEMYGVDFTKVKTTEEMKAFITNYEENLRPGDIMLFYGHAMLYIGNGYVLDSGGTTYKMDLGVESFETAGTVDYLHPSVVDIYVNGVGDTGVNYKLESQPQRYMVIIRPLNVLCSADSDEDPANDPLNAEYTLPEFSALVDGMNLLYHKDAKTSGYTITDTTLSRMDYPAMEIDRTVDITRYGTVVKDGQLTYSVKISNKSNNASYCTYQSAVRGENYAGEGYTGLVVTETIPAGTVLVADSITAGGQYSNGTITWTVDVAAGATVECAYTVNVTGNIGDVITNGGGMVADIPSNTITNTIGGAKLENTKVEALADFYDEGVNKFAENGVGATRLDTKFASRIYQAVLGIDLTLPTSQELLNNLFERKTIYSANRYMTNYDTKTLFQAYVLKDAADVADDYQAWRDMVIADYIGGTQVWTDFENGEARINQFSTDYLEPGDVLIYGNLDGSNSADYDRNVTETKVLVYVGDDKFVSMTTAGMPAVSEGAELNLWPAFSYDFLFALRPSQAYADINELAYTGGATYEAEFGSVAPYDGLTDENQQAFAALTDVNNKSNMQVIGIAYDKLGIDIANDLMIAGGKTVAYASAMDSVFFQQTAESVVDKQEGYRYELRAAAPAGSEKLFSMLVDGWYGGRLVPASGRTDFSLSTLKIGDALVLGTRNTVDKLRAYWVALYQGYDEGAGKGKFLISKLDDTAKKDGSNTYTETVYYSADEFQTQMLNKQIAYTDTEGNPQTIAHWQSWFLLRPSQAYDNINAIGGIVPNVSALSLVNQAKLAGVTKEKDGLTQAHLALVREIYEAIGLDISAELGTTNNNKPGVNDTMKGSIFTKTGTGAESVYTICSATDTSNPALLSMLVDGWYGGNNVTGAPASTGHTLDSLQVGDALVLGILDESKNDYAVYVYQGDGQFLRYRRGSGIAQETLDKAGFAALLANQIEVTGNYYTGNPWHCYYLLRPSQAYADINMDAMISEGLNTANQTALAGVTVEKDEIDQAYLALVTEAYGAVGLDISAEIGTTANHKPSVSDTIQGSIFTRKKAGSVVTYTICAGNTTKNPTLFAMLVDGWYGGGNVVNPPTGAGHTLASLQIGDALVLGNIDDVSAASKKGDYAVYVYQGAGQFLRYRRGLDIAQESLDETGFAALLANTTAVSSNYYTGASWQCYYLIRPSQAFADINKQAKPLSQGDDYITVALRTTGNP